MGRTPRTWWPAALTLFLAGCISGPLQDNPVLLRPQEPGVHNPVYIPLNPQSYAQVFEKTLAVISDYFEVAYSNRYDGRIETFPRVAPGVLQPWKPGSPDWYQRLLASFQSIRHRAIVLIHPAEDGGFFIDVKVYRELEDVAQPIRALSNTSVFRTDNMVKHQFEVVDATTYEAVWIPIGRDFKLEQILLERLAQCDLPNVHQPQPPPPPGPPVPAPQFLPGR